MGGSRSVGSLDKPAYPSLPGQLSFADDNNLSTNSWGSEHENRREEQRYNNNRPFVNSQKTLKTGQFLKNFPFKLYSDLTNFFQ